MPARARHVDVAPPDRGVDVRSARVCTGGVHPVAIARGKGGDLQSDPCPVWALGHRIAERKWLNGAVLGLPPVTGLHAACKPRCIPRI
jgi:hypothetical protein